MEAEPDAIRAAGVVVASGDDWHEGVVGIVASRLAERFERPAIVLSRQGETAKGSGRSVAGVDLHSLVSAAAGPLTRWGGHAGAIGLELPAGAIARFRDELMAAAEGVRAAIARARVRTVDAVVGGRDLTLATAEELERLAPFGRGNPPVRLVVPGVALESPSRVGDGQHLQVRIRSGGVHARAIGFRMGERAPGIDVDARHDAVIELDVERWQGIVGPRVTLQALDPVSPARRRSPLWAEAVEAHDRGCAEPDLRALAADPLPPAAATPVRRAGAARACATAGERGPRSARSPPWRGPTAAWWPSSPTPPGAARPWRPRSTPGAWAPRWWCSAAGAAARRRCASAWPWRAASRPWWCWSTRDLALVAPPEGAHLVLVDPPGLAGRGAVGRPPRGRSLAAPGLGRAGGRRRAGGLGGALGAAAHRRPPSGSPCATASRASPGGRSWPPRLLGDPALPRQPRVAARALAVLGELGLVEIDARGVRAAAGPERRELDASPLYRAPASGWPRRRSSSDGP